MTALPKAELHVHLEGTLEPEDLARFARRNGLTLPWPTAGELRAAYSFTGLEDFLAVYFAGCRVLRTREDFHDLTAAYLRRAAGQGVRRAEMLFGPQVFLDHGVGLEAQLGGITDAIAEAREQSGIDGALLVSAHRHRREADALELLDLVRPWREHVLGVGLGGAERGNPPSKFARYFAAARAEGYRTTCHAGEEGPAAYIREALEVCRVERIDHGYTATDDPGLVARLADEQVTLTLCPLSNLRLHVTEDLAAYPLRALMDAGVPVTVNSDDPSYFGGYVNENYAAVTEALGLTGDEVEVLVRNSFTGSFAPPEEIRAARLSGA
ncbi:adenosine deaminase [Amycolatopsis sp. PS_44_ISF1]|uniref:adenosine deaminase n=1 Tax=Amycolatopsis sp. PS_44_ISF1 TaxID=2974917 RepID=UPI0028DEB085|nr:adenosine deaminase [Amycolatopsis sp. PS_44_ISF1]MDT8915197.1 adenosine deaminase [Amycolatopsis sp. PS_44_ISF1]